MFLNPSGRRFYGLMRPKMRCYGHHFGVNKTLCIVRNSLSLQWSTCTNYSNYRTYIDINIDIDITLKKWLHLMRKHDHWTVAETMHIWHYIHLVCSADILIPLSFYPHTYVCTFVFMSEEAWEPGQSPEEHSNSRKKKQRINEGRSDGKKKKKEGKEMLM